jgi:hypothetical protein
MNRLRDIHVTDMPDGAQHITLLYTQWNGRMSRIGLCVVDGQDLAEVRAGIASMFDEIDRRAREVQP